MRVTVVSCLVAASLLTVAFLGIRGIIRDPGVYWLTASESASWIVFPEPRSMRMRAQGRYRARFAKTFEVERLPAEAIVEYRTFRTGRVWLDGERLDTFAPPLTSWKTTRHIDLTAMLTPGSHSIEFEVSNDNSYPALWARSDALDLATDESWQVSPPEGEWIGAASAHRFEGAAPLADHFEPSYVALARLWPLLITVLALASLFTLRRGASTDSLFGRRPTPGGVRWLLIGAVALLGLNNLFRLPWSIGFDVAQHVDYIDYIIANRALPLATDGWEMFQAPLYYVVSTPFALIFRSLASQDTALSLLRIVPMACGVAHIEVARRVMGAAFPSRDDMQIFGLVCAALLPMNLLLSQTIGNETTSALLTGLTILLAVRLLQDASFSSANLASLGCVWGLALLAKSSALLLAPALCSVVVYAALARPGSGGRPIESAAAGLGVLLGSALLVAGWFYARNWIELGSPFHLGWDPEAGLAWWQDPGYRTPEQLMRFGTAIVQPINAVHHGFWDGLYSSLFADGYLSSRIRFEDRPPWNYTFMLAGTLLSLAPASMILTGGLGALRRPRLGEDRIALLAIACIAIYVAAILYLWLQIPNYSITKASYTTGLASCYGILAARGYATLGRTPTLRAVSFAALVGWAICVWCSFLVVGH